MKKYKWIGGERYLPLIGRVRTGDIVFLPDDAVASLERQGLVKNISKEDSEK